MEGISLSEAMEKATAEEEVSQDQDTASEEAKAEETSAENQKQNEEGEIDYKAKLAEYEERAKRAEKGREKALDALKRVQGAVYRKDEDEEEPEEEALQESESSVKSEIQKLREERVSDLVDSEVERMTGNEDEQRLIKAIFHNDLKVTDTSKEGIRLALQKARGLANLPKLQAIEEKQVKKSQAEVAAMKASASKVGGIGRQPPEADEPTRTKEEEQLLKWAEKVASRYKR